MTPPRPTAITNWPLAARLASLEHMPNVWRILIVADGHEEAVAEDMSLELASLAERNVTHRRIRGADELIALTEHEPDDILVVSGLAQFDERAWRVVDINRSRLAREAPTLLIVGASTVGQLPSSAPNLWSWIGDAVWRHDAESGLTDEARDARLVELRRHFGFGDAELLRLARAGQLPSEPDIAEWLVLLGEGSLIHAEDAP